MHGPAAALDYFQRALDLLEPTGQNSLHGIALNNLGEVHLDLGHLAEAADCFERALVIFTAVNDKTGKRDICIYPRDPHVMVGLAPDELFLDPSYTYRLDLHRYRPAAELIRGVFVRTVTSEAEMAAINDIYARNGMVVGDPATMWRNHRTRTFTWPGASIN